MIASTVVPDDAVTTELAVRVVPFADATPAVAALVAPTLVVKPLWAVVVAAPDCMVASTVDNPLWLGTTVDAPLPPPQPATATTAHSQSARIDL